MRRNDLDVQRRSYKNNQGYSRREYQDKEANITRLIGFILIALVWITPIDDIIPFIDDISIITYSIKQVLGDIQNGVGNPHFKFTESNGFMFLLVGLFWLTPVDDVLIFLDDICIILYSVKQVFNEASLMFKTTSKYR